MLKNSQVSQSIYEYYSSHSSMAQYGSKRFKIAQTKLIIFYEILEKKQEFSMDFRNINYSK